MNRTRSMWKIRQIGQAWQVEARRPDYLFTGVRLDNPGIVLDQFIRDHMQLAIGGTHARFTQIDMLDRADDLRRGRTPTRVVQGDLARNRDRRRAGAISDHGRAAGRRI